MATRFFLCDLKIYPNVCTDILTAKSNFDQKQQYTEYWTCGNMVNIAVNDVAYFVRVKDSKRGIFASGLVLEPPAEGAIKFCWNAVVCFDNPLLFTELLQRPDFEGANFALRGSGYKLADKYAPALDTAWQQHVSKFGSRGINP